MAFFGVTGPSNGYTGVVVIPSTSTFHGAAQPSQARTGTLELAAGTFKGVPGPSAARTQLLELAAGTFKGVEGPSQGYTGIVEIPSTPTFKGVDGPSNALTDFMDFAKATTFHGVPGPSQSYTGVVQIPSTSTFHGVAHPSQARTQLLELALGTFHGVPGPSASRTGIVEIPQGTFHGVAGPSHSRTDVIDYLPLGIHESQVEYGTIPLTKIAKPLFDATLDALKLIADGFFSADATGRAKFANGFFTPAKLAVVPQEKLTPLETVKNAASMRDTDKIVTTGATVNEDEAKSFADVATQEIKVAFLVPLLYDNATDITFTIKLAPSTSFSGNFRLSAEYRVNGGALSLATLTTTTPSGTADTLTEATVLTIAAANVNPGDRVLVKLKRLGSDVADTHTGAMRVFQMKMAVPTT